MSSCQVKRLWDTCYDIYLFISCTSFHFSDISRGKERIAISAVNEVRFSILFKHFTHYKANNMLTLTLLLELIIEMISVLNKGPLNNIFP